jgi:hypothetical protein
VAGSRHRPSRRSARRRDSHTDRAKERWLRHRLIRRILIGAVVVLALCSVVLLLLWWRAETQVREREAAVAAELNGVSALAKAYEERIRELEQRLAELVAGNLPKPFLPLRADDLIDLSQVEPLLRNVLFTQVGTPEHPGYEYRLNCRNEGQESVQPRLVILVFNECGVQTGIADVTRSPDWTRLGASGLAPGESCAFSGRIEFQFSDAPKYFVVTNQPLGAKLPRLSP